jgi:uncharacterized protein YdeI (YjbR/CyaY-like superfamily)
MTPSQEITRYIAALPEPAKSICTKLRAIILKAVPDIKEDWKWGPNYNYNGMVCGVGGFKKHAVLHFFNGAQMKDSRKLFNFGGDNEFSRSIKFNDISEISEKYIAGYVKESAAINKAGYKRTKATKEDVVPDDLYNALRKKAVARKFFDALTPGYKNQFIELAETAKTRETRDKRIEKVVGFCADGIKLHDKYKK